MADSTTTTETSTTNHEENWCDPVVIFDPSGNKNVVGKALNDSTGKAGLSDPQQDTVKIDGINFPVLMINNTVIQNSDIIDMDLLFIGLLPKITVIVADDNYKKSEQDVPTLASNMITCIITMAGPITYKKISMNFYVTDFLAYEEDGQPVVKYEGEFYYKDFQKIYHKQIKAIEGSEAAGNSLSTYEMLYAIAKETGLGFAASDQAKEVQDNRYRICQSKNYAKFIQDEIEFSGTDETNFLDAWIDPFGYLVLVNVPYLFNTDVQTTELTIQALTGVTTSNTTTYQQDWEEMYRVLTNHPSAGKRTSLNFDAYKEYVNNNVTATGVAKHHITFGIKKDSSGSTEVNQFDTQLNDETSDGQQFADSYTCFEKWFFPGIEMGDSCILQQRSLRKSFFEKKKMRVLTLDLNQPNLGIQRGTLIYVMIFETNQVKKEALIDAMDTYSNPTSTENSEKAKQAKIDTVKGANGNADGALFNFALSDFYYVNGIELQYKDEQIYQKLYLIKKNDHVQLNGASMLPKLS